MFDFTEEIYELCGTSLEVEEQYKHMTIEELVKTLHVKDYTIRLLHVMYSYEQDFSNCTLQEQLESLSALKDMYNSIMKYNQHFYNGTEDTLELCELSDYEEVLDRKLLAGMRD